MKKCIKCKIEKEIIEFSFKIKKLDLRQNKCRECFKEYRKVYYNKNKEKAIEYSKESNKIITKRNREFIYKYLLQNPCIDCKEKSPILLEFDHRSDKKYNISDMITKGYSLISLQKEIDKCDVRCANCHRIKTARDFNFWMYRRCKFSSSGRAQDFQS